MYYIIMVFIDEIRFFYNKNIHLFDKLYEVRIKNDLYSLDN
jgi:hypothetical protein